MAKQQLGNIGATTTAAKSSTTASHRPSRDSKERTGECLDDIEDSKKWRLIQESGLLEKIHIPTDKHIHTTSNASESNQDESILGVRRDYISEGVLFSIPTTCLFIIIDILVHRQAGDDYSTQLIVQKILKIFPVLVMAYFSNRAKSHKLVHGAMFLTATSCGCYFIHTMFKSPALGLMKQAPGVITILVYCIVQLNIITAVASLAICGAYYLFESATIHH